MEKSDKFRKRVVKTPVPKRERYVSKTKTEACQTCNFKTNSDVDMEHHNRDKHSEQSVFISPPKKKQEMIKKETENI